MWRGGRDARNPQQKGGSLSNCPIETAEERLRAAFGRREALGYAKEASDYSLEVSGLSKAVPDIGAGRAELDPDRLNAAHMQLGWLVDVARVRWRDGRHPYWSERELVAAEGDALLAGEMAAALAQSAPFPRTTRAPFVAELMIASDGSRPASLIRGGSLYQPAQLGQFGLLWNHFLPDLPASIAATGRIEINGRHIGSGILIRWPLEGAGTAVLTARHVAAPLARVGSTHMCAGLTIDFLGEVGTLGAHRHRLVERLRWGGGAERHNDFAILRLGDPMDDIEAPLPITVDADPLHVAPQNKAAVVSYPGLPQGASRAMFTDETWRQLFEGLWHVKRLSPAMIMEGGILPLIRHDATTTSGSSGGALLSPGSGGLAGLHLGGDIPGRDTPGHNVALHVAALNNEAQNT